MNPRHSLRLVSLFTSLLFFSVAGYGQISVPDFTPPPEKKAVAEPSLEAQVARQQAPRSLVQSTVAPIKELRLNALTAAERATTRKQKRVRIGLLRPLPNNALKFTDFSRVAQPDGTLYLLRVASPSALSLRLHITDLALPEGATLFASSRTKPAAFAGPYNRQTTQRELWTPSLPGEEILVELFIPAAVKLDALPFRLEAVSHLYRNPRALLPSQASPPGSPEAAGECEQEVPAEWRSKANAVGLIAFVKTDGEYACSGTLLTDVKKTRTPFFLTANHCIGNDQEANSAEVYWFFDSGTEPTAAPTRGAKVLVTDVADDYTLLEVGPPPGGVTYSGWTTAPPDIGTAVTTIHHPQADHKRFSVGQVVEASCPAEVAPEFCNFYTKVRWTLGITEPGSSGGGLFVGPANDSRLIGILSGGESACDNLSGVDWYGRFNRMFGAIGYYLTNGELCRYTLLQDQFLYNANASSGELTIVPKIGGENCPWQARSNVDWLTITNASGNGLGKVTFQITANTSGQQRLGAITVAGRNVLVRQNPDLAPTATCAPTKIAADQPISGDLNASPCTSWFDPSMRALQYAIEGATGQPLTLNFQLSLAHIKLRVISPDGTVTTFGTSYGIFLPATGTHILEIARVPTSFEPPGNFSFTLYKGCGVKLSPTYFEVDGFGQLLAGPAGPLQVKAETSSSTCSLSGASADEPIIDENKLHSVPRDADKTIYLNVAGAQDPKRRYIVVRIAGQPIIIRQLPRCSSATTFAYTPSELNLPGTGGQFQMQIKRTAGPSCSWEIKPFEITDSGQRETREVLMQPENYGNWVLGTDDGMVTYRLPTNQYFKNNRFVLQNNGQVAQTILQTFLGGTCARTSLQVGQTVNGQLTTADCGWSEAGQYVDVYQITLAEGEQYALEMTGTAGAEISAEQGIIEYGSLGPVADFRQKASFRSPETGFYSVSTPGTYLLRVFGKPGTYQVKILGLGPAGCVYRIDKEQTGYFIPANTTSYNVKLDCNRGDCDWTAQSSASWITFPQGTSGKGSQMLTLALVPNTGAKREATITIAGRTFYLTQDYSCSYRQYSTAAPNKFFASYQGGEYRYFVETGATCPAPSMTPSAAWITATYPQPGVITLMLAANMGGFRTGTLNIAGDRFEVLQGGNDLVVTTAADYQRLVAPGSLVTVFNQGMTTKTEAAQTVPLPNVLADTAISLELSDQTTILVPLLYAAPTQINFYLPESVPAGRTKIRLSSSAASYGNSSAGYYAIGEFDIALIAPNVFSADSSGKGPAAANIQRIRPGQADVYEPVATLTTDEQGKPLYVARPFTIGGGEEKTYLVLYATGLRKRNASAAVTARIGDATLPVEYAGAQGQFVGLDQINILLPSSLRGKGLVNVTITIDGKTTNPVQVNFAP
jgi:uncharacterized protein (TIGR03437 family)